MNHKFVENTVREAYEDPETVARYSRDQNLWLSEELLIARFFPKHGEVLDLGCGAGRTSIPLALKGYKVTGMDLSDHMLGLAMQRSIQQGAKIVWLQMDATSLAFAGTSFDAAIFSFNAMDHMPGYGGKLHVLQQVFRVLRPGAPFIFSAHKIWSPFHLTALIRGSLRLSLGKMLGFRTAEKEWGEIHKLAAKAKEERYGHFMTSKTWTAAIRAAGFEVLTNRSRSQLEGRTLATRIRRSLSSGNYEFFVARRPGRG